MKKSNRTYKHLIGLLLSLYLLALTACGAAVPQESSKVPSSAPETAGTEAAPKPSVEESAGLSEQETAAPSGTQTAYEPGSAQAKKTDAAFREAYLGLAAKLFRTQYAEQDPKASSLVSPLSILIALTMTANGAKEGTLAEMTALLGGNQIDLEALNQYILGYIKSLPSADKARLALADAIWVNDIADFSVLPAFLQKNRDYFNAEVYKAPFGPKTLDELNSWVEKNTDGMIKKILDELSDDARMVLINALCFDAKWAEPFYEDYVHEQTFRAADGREQPVPMMHGSVYSYLKDQNTAGFVKSYEGGTYGFAALLPEEGIPIDDYIASLSAEKLKALLGSESSEKVNIGLPKFSYDCSWLMNDALRELGMPQAFDPAAADFRGMSEDTRLYISKVIHKTHIEVAEEGTRAAAVTAVVMDKSASIPTEVKTVVLDRPFVYMIIDMENRLPVFIGAVTEISEN